MAEEERATTIEIVVVSDLSNHPENKKRRNERDKRDRTERTLRIAIAAVTWNPRATPGRKRNKQNDKSASGKYNNASLAKNHHHYCQPHP